MGVVVAGVIGGVVGAAIGGGGTKLLAPLGAVGGLEGADERPLTVFRNAAFGALILGGAAGANAGLAAEGRFEAANICPHLMASMESGSSDRIIIERNADGRYECALR